MRSALKVVLVVVAGAGCQPERSTGHVTIVGAPDNAGVVVRNDYTNSDDSGTEITTDASGAYFFHGDLPGLVTATAPWTVEGKKTWSTRYNNAGYPDFTFTAAGGIAGRATLGGAEDGNAGIVITIADKTVMTDETGAFSMPIFAIGTYPVTAVAIGHHEGLATVTVTYKAVTTLPQIDLVPD